MDDDSNPRGHNMQLALQFDEEAWYACWSNIICQPGSQRIVRDTIQLSEKDRNRVYGDLGGAPETNVESNEFVCQVLVALHMELAKVQGREAFDLARQQNEHYTDNPGFRMLFLRVNHYNAEKAAAQMVAHFKAKLDLFDQARLAEDITLNDLDEDDMECLRRGSFQVLPKSDTFRRTVVFSRYATWKYKKSKNILRAEWYVTMVIMQSEYSQRFGVILLGYSVKSKPTGPVDFEVIRQLLRLNAVLPIRLAAFYFCFSDKIWQSVADLIVHLSQPVIRVRFRYFQGSDQECRYKLLVMGIPAHHIPVTADGVLTYHQHDRWIERQRQEEITKSSSKLHAHLNTMGRTHQYDM